MQLSTTSHFYDQYQAKLFLDNGQVLKVGDPNKFTAENSDRIINALERILRRKGIIGSQDSLLWVQ